MRLLVVFCHPSRDSFGAAVLDQATSTLEGCGHDLRIRDLYREGFDPVLTEQDWARYIADPAANIARVQDHVTDLQWAEGLIVIYPTWYYGPPAVLKGWLDRVWLPGVSFELAPQKGRIARGKLSNIRTFVGLTTSGSPWWWLKLIGDPGRSLWTRGLRPIFNLRCRYRWCQLYSINDSSSVERAAHLEKVAQVLRNL